jgi:hypothetical protein
MDGFKYDPIDLEGRSFRVVRLLQGDTHPIRCELFESWLDRPDSDVDFTALSYTWGAKETPCRIVVNGSSLAITRNLYSALEQLRRKEKDCIVWTDAICIDQGNGKERGHQVGQMASIYSKAERVVIWLGPSTEEADLFMDAAAEFSKTRLKQEHANWTPLDTHWITVWKIILKKRSYNEEAVCRGLDSLLDRPWFKRIWVLQEVANARIADVVCGSKSIPAKTFVLASHLTGVTPYPRCQAVLDIMPGASRNSSWWTQRRDLRTLLAKFGASEASDSRDIIYALLGMSTDACASGFLYANYEVSVEQAIHNTMLFLVGLHECDRNGLHLPSWSLTDFLSKLDDLSTAIYWSKPSWDVSSIKVLVDMGLDLDAMLHHAVVHGDVQEVKALIKLGARVNERSKGNETTFNKATLDLFVTDSLGYWDKIRWCAEGETALFRGVRRGDLDIVSLLIENGANINDESNGETALSTAVQTWNEGILSLLIKGGADRGEKFNGATLSSSAKGKMKIVRQLIDSSLDHFRKAVSGLKKTPFSVHSWEHGDFGSPS